MARPQALEFGLFGKSDYLSGTIAVIMSAGVTSNAGFCAGVPSGAARTPANDVTSSARRSSMMISLPVPIAASIVLAGATT